MLKIVKISKLFAALLIFFKVPIKLSWCVNIFLSLHAILYDFYYASFSTYLHGKNDFAKKSKILLDIDLKIILLDHQINFVENLKNNEQCCKKSLIF